MAKVDFNALSVTLTEEFITDRLMRGKILKVFARRVLGRLRPYLRVVLNERYGLHDQKPKTPEEIADALGVELSTVEALEADALRASMGYGKRVKKAVAYGSLEN